ncbi:MAG TPA: glycosyltransferase family 2 protein [Caulobacteraceae bacterium]
MTPKVSIVVPVFDEIGAAGPLAAEIARAFAGEAFELLFVDDASGDGVGASLIALKDEIPQLRVLVHARNAGQSRALRTGILAATAPVIVTLDGDGQNDPADAPALVATLLNAPACVGLVGGVRVRRRDPAAKRWASLAANAVRRRLLADEASDTGCGLKVFRRDAFLRLASFDHMHRYLPALMKREGYGVLFQEVSHRPRQSGRSKYTNAGRLWAAVSDLLGVLWLKARSRDPGDIREPLNDPAPLAGDGR